MTIGLGDNGFGDPLFKEIYDLFASLWLSKVGKPLAAFKAEDDFFRIVAERLSNRDLDDADTRQPAIWQEIKKIFFSAYVDWATGVSLDYATQYRGLSRSVGESSKSIFIFSGASGVVIPSQTTISKVGSEDIKVKTTRSGTISPSGFIAIPVVAENPGAIYNSSEGTFNQLLEDPADVTVTNQTASFNFVLGDTEPDNYSSVSNTGFGSSYQLIDIDDLVYAASLKSIDLRIKNPLTTTALFDLQIEFFNDADGALLFRTAVQTVSLGGDASQKLTFDNIFQDFSQIPLVRIALVNHATSDSDILVGYNNVISGGGWAPDGNLDSTKDATMEIVSKINGELLGGIEEQSDINLRSRYHQVVFNAAGGTPNGLWSKLMMLPQVRGVKIYPNSADSEKLVAPGLTLPRKSFAAVVDGGDPDDIAVVIYSSGAGMMSVGNYTRVVSASSVLEPVSWYVPVRDLIQIRAKLSRKANYPKNGDTLVKDEIIKIVGGFDSKGNLHDGLEIGEGVSHAHLVSATLNIPGIKFADVRVGRQGDTLLEDDIVINALDRAWTDTTLIEII